MVGTKKYLQPKDMLLNAVHDLAELQKGNTVLCDTLRGLVGMVVTVYATQWDYTFTVTDIGGNRTEVAIALEGEPTEVKRLIDHEFALLDYVLIDRSKADLAELEELDRKFSVQNENK